MQFGDLIHHLLAHLQLGPCDLPVRKVLLGVVHLTRGHVEGRVNSADSFGEHVEAFRRVSLEDAAADDEAVLNGIAQLKNLLFVDQLLCLGLFQRFFDHLVPKFALLGYLGVVGVTGRLPEPRICKSYFNWLFFEISGCLNI